LGKLSTFEEFFDRLWDFERIPPKQGSCTWEFSFLGCCLTDIN